MHHTLKAALTALTVVSATACSEAPSQPAAVDVDALIEAAPVMDPAALTAGLDLDPQLKAHVDASLGELHAAMLHLHERHEELAAMDENERAPLLGELKGHVQEIHQRHQALWNFLPEDGRQALVERMHGQLQQYHEHLSASPEQASAMHKRAKEHLHRLHMQQQN